MTRAILVALGWLAACLALYLAVLGLELYWNLYDWQPQADWRAMAIILGALAILVSLRWLARATRHRFSQTVASLACLALVALAVYVSPAEPLTQGLFARTMPSPLWYRAARLVLMSLPGVFFIVEWRRHKSKQKDNGAAQP